MYIAKAIAAFIIAAVSLYVGDDVAKGMDIGVIEGAVVAILTALGVYAVPNSVRATGGIRRVP